MLTDQTPSDCKCERCGDPATRNHQNTIYTDDTLNWATLCPMCQADMDAYWNERWNEYWRSVY